MWWWWLGAPPPKHKTKTIPFAAVPFSPPSTSIKLISEYTHVHAQTTEYLKKKNLKIMGCTLATQPSQKSSQVSSRQKYLPISSIPIQQATFLSSDFQKAKPKSKL